MTYWRKVPTVINTVKRKFDEVLSDILRFAADTLNSGEGEFTRISSILRNDNPYWPFFLSIGALDNTHILVRLPSRNADAYKDRKKERTMNVLCYM